MRASFHALSSALFACGLALVACVTHEFPTNDGAGDDDDGGETAQGLPACAYSTTVTGGTATVAFARTFLDCELSASYESCLSNDPTICPDHGTSVHGGTTIACTNQCEDDQYAISVDLGVTTGGDGSVFTPTSPTLPSSCLQASVNPGGIEFFCCSCPTGS